MRRLGAYCAITRKIHTLAVTVTTVTVTRCHGCSDRLRSWTFALVANANFRIRMISVYLANARATRIKIKIEPSFTQWVRAMLGCLLSVGLIRQLHFQGIR